MKKIAFVFPGQGSQSMGMLSELASSYPIIRETFDFAGKILGYNLWELAQHGPEEQLNQTEYAQPILLTAGFAVWQAWQKQGMASPDFFAGHSLGEYTALVCAESIDFADALKLVRKRGQIMQAAVPVGKGAMVAVVGLTEDKVLEICAAAKQNEILSAANYNSIGQVVLAGDIEACKRVVALAQAAGAKLVKLLPVSVPSHCELMRSASEFLEAELNNIDILTPKIPVLHNADVLSYADPKSIRSALVKQLYSPVRWVEIIQFLAKNGIEAIFECGPGKVLTGLNKRIVNNVAVNSLQSPDGFLQARTIINNNGY